jgi:glycosidase
MSEKYKPRNHPALYEINTVPWLRELSHRYGKTLRLSDIPSEEWDSLKQLGMDYIWLMGIWQHSPISRQICLHPPLLQAEFKAALPDLQDADIIGSAYAIFSYEPDPLIGGWQDLEIVRRQLHQRNMGLILDFVPNHTACDHAWVTQHPEYYIQGSKKDFSIYPQSFFEVKKPDSIFYFANGRDPNFPPWTDTAQLNLFNPALRSALIQQVEKIAQYCDGLRCDMAMLAMNSVFKKTWGWNNAVKAPPSVEFWQELTRSVPQLLYIAETYWDTEWQLQQLGFDFTYDKRLYDRLRYSPTHDIYLHLTAEMSYQNKLLRFIENHDEVRSLSAFGSGKLKSVAVLYSLLPGMRLFYDGQLSGSRIRTPVQLGRYPHEAPDNEITPFYQKLLSIVKSEISHSGTWKLKKVYQHADNNFMNLLAYTWQLEQNLLLVIVNLSPLPAQGRVVFQEDIDESLEYSFKETFSEIEFIRPGIHMAHPGLIFELEGFQAQIYAISGRENN